MKVNVSMGVDCGCGSLLGKRVDVRVSTLREASEAVRRHIEGDNVAEVYLGSSEWTGTGDVTNDAGERVAVVSYNGRVWTPEARWEDRREIVL